MQTIYALLTKKSEQERRLLSALVNKLGDPEGKAGSDAVFHLLNLLREHPNMMAVVIEEVDSFLFRPHLGMRAKYYAINFLSQIRLRKGGYGPKVAKRLMDVYFALFKVLITGTERGQKLENKKQNEGKKGSVNLQNAKGETGVETNVEMDSRLLVALLTGVKRAFPYVASDEADDLVEVQTPMLFKLVHSKNFNVGVQSLMLLYDITSKNQIASDRFYRALYSKLPTPSVMNSSKSEMFLELLVKVMKNDINLKRVSAFSKRLLQGALQQPPQYACGCLLILSDVLKARPPLWNLMLQNESVDDDFEHFEDIKEESQIAVDATPSMLEKSVDLVSATNDSNGVKTSSDPSESEDEEDPPASSSETEDNSEEENLIAVNGSTNVGEFEKVSDHDGGKEVKEFIKGNKGSPLPGGYNPQHREPLYCNADRTSWWELAVLALHVHPSVATMARTLLSGQHIIYNGNPLVDLSLSAFLDKFMEKKPKPNRRAEGIWHGGSQIAPARKLDTGHHLIGADILSLAEEDVPPEDLVFHRFYVNKASSSKKKKKKPAEDEAAEELFDVADSDESDEGEIDDMLGSGTLPSENEGNYDYDDLDEVANEDDEDLLGDGSDGDVGSLATADGGLSRSDDDDNNIGEDGGDVDNEIGGSGRKNKKRKVGGKSGVSPFAALEEYDHLLNDDENVRRKTAKSQRKSH